jgi:uncharacterized protein
MAEYGGGLHMGQPVVHFEIIGADPERLRGYYGELFGWQYDTTGQVSREVSEPSNYGFIDRNTAPDGAGIPGGVGGGGGYRPQTVFYVGVDNVEQALQRAERLGGTRALDPWEIPGLGKMAVFEDPEGNRVGLWAS